MPKLSPKKSEKVGFVALCCSRFTRWSRMVFFCFFRVFTFIALVELPTGRSKSGPIFSHRTFGRKYGAMIRRNPAGQGHIPGADDNSMVPHRTPRAHTKSRSIQPLEHYQHQAAKFTLVPTPCHSGTDRYRPTPRYKMVYGDRPNAVS